MNNSITNSIVGRRIRNVVAAALIATAGAAATAPSANAEIRPTPVCVDNPLTLPDLVASGVTADAFYTSSWIRVTNRGADCAPPTVLRLTNAATREVTTYSVDVLAAGSSVSLRVTNMCNRFWTAAVDATNAVLESDERNSFNYAPSCF